MSGALLLLAGGAYIKFGGSGGSGSGDLVEETSGGGDSNRGRFGRGDDPNWKRSREIALKISKVSASYDAVDDLSTNILSEANLSEHDGIDINLVNVATSSAYQQCYRRWSAN
jgi:hypothetical protein